MSPNFLVCSSPIQLVLETIAQYFQSKIGFIHLQAILEGNERCHDNSADLNKSLPGLIHFQEYFHHFTGGMIFQ